MPKVLDRTSTQRLSKRELREEAEALIVESQIEAKKLAKAKRAESKAHRERVVRLTGGNPLGQYKSRLDESMQVMNISRQVHPSEQVSNVCCNCEEILFKNTLLTCDLCVTPWYLLLDASCQAAVPWNRTAVPTNPRTAPDSRFH